MHNAAYDGNLPIVQLLLDSGADPSIKNSNNQTAFDVAKKVKIKRILLKAMEKNKQKSHFSK